jgi:hypothetical protein
MQKECLGRIRIPPQLSRASVVGDFALGTTRPTVFKRSLITQLAARTRPSVLSRSRAGRVALGAGPRRRSATHPGCPAAFRRSTRARCVECPNLSERFLASRRPQRKSRKIWAFHGISFPKSDSARSFRTVRCARLVDRLALRIRRSKRDPPRRRPARNPCAVEFLDGGKRSRRALGPRKMKVWPLNLRTIFGSRSGTSSSSTSSVIRSF